MGDEEEFRRWLEAAMSSLTMVEVATAAAQHHHACFHAEQSSQQALKGLVRGLGAPERAFGHNLAALAEAAGELAGVEIESQLLDALARLARHYIPTRDPDALPTGSPADSYRLADAEQARQDADTVLEFTRFVWQDVQDSADEDE
jgi:HEPN domain-containing protein